MGTTSFKDSPLKKGVSAKQTGVVINGQYFLNKKNKIFYFARMLKYQHHYFYFLSLKNNECSAASFSFIAFAIK